MRLLVLAQYLRVLIVQKSTQGISKHALKGVGIKVVSFYRSAA